MLPNQQPVARELLTGVEETYRNLPLGFTGPKYWEALRLTYARTIGDILELAEQVAQQPGREAGPVRVLEVGAFAGLVSTALRRSGKSVTATDIPQFMRDPQLRAHYQAEGIVAVESDLSQLPLPLPVASYDIVVCCEVLEHLNFNPLPVCRDFHRLLRPSGFLYLATPNQANIVKRLSLLRGRSVHDPIDRLEWQLDPSSSFSIGLHWREYTAQELRELFALAGFETHHQYFCHYVERRHSNWLRQNAVGSMYALWPALLPGQVAVAKKPAAG